MWRPLSALGTLAAGLAFPCFAQSVVKFADLAKTRLPYNQKIVIEGTISEDFKDIVEVMKIKTVAVSYSTCTDSSLQSEGPAVPVAGDRWAVNVGPFEEGEKVCFRFLLAGNLTPEAAVDVVNKIFASPLYAQEITTFFERASGQENDVADALARAMGDRLRPVIIASLPKQVRGQVSAAVAMAFVDALVNLRVRVRDMVDVVPGVTAAMSPSDARRRVQSLQPADYQAQFPLGPTRTQAQQDRLIEDAKESANLFVAEYDRIQKTALAASLQSNVDVAVDQIESAEVKYLEKYAAVDVGSLWIPRLNEFRAFAMLNIYWGPVELTPAPMGAKPTDWFKERTSLVIGYSLANISSSHESKIRGNNVWIYGLGFRVNRYFRVSCGGALYRGARQDSGLRNDFYVGPSLDLTAIEYFKRVFAKIK